VDGEYREEPILNVTVFVVSFWWRGSIDRNCTECYCGCCECLVEGEYREELILNVNEFVVSFS
jgi:hypothetical protein